MAWPILGVDRFCDIDRDVLLQAGAALGLAKGTAQRILESLRRRAGQEAEALYAEIEHENAGIAHARPELSATLAGEARCLRTILHVVFKETTRQTA